MAALTASILRHGCLLKSLMSKGSQINKIASCSRLITSLPDYRFIYPEFLPNPDMSRRNKLREKLERMDMLKRRTQIEIPEFYVGSYMAVVVSDPNAPGKKSRFVGICIDRAEHGLRAFFTLRNVIDNEGVEIMYDLYNPLLQSIDVLKLEKRLDVALYYLRDAPHEYSTVPFDMAPIPHLEGSAVPINPIKVKLRPYPWHQRWELHDLKGVQDSIIPEKRRIRAERFAKPWEKFDLMKEYRVHVPEEHQQEIFTEVHDHHLAMSELRRKTRKRRSVVRPQKTA